MITPVQFLNIKGTVFFAAILIIASTSPSWGNGNEPCTTRAAQGAGHAIWLSKYHDGKNANFFFDDQGGKLVENQDGTAKVYGLLHNKKDPQDKWEVQLWLSDRMSWEEWSSLGRDYKDEHNKAGDLYKTWSYYIMDPAKESKLVGKGQNEGTTIPLKHNPINYKYGFQVGQAANSKNEKYGLSGWFLYFLNSDEPRQGDFNLDLDCPVKDPEDCPECFSSDLISVVQSGTGCATYTMEVSNDGGCKHALSHYSVDIPCGTVSNITNTGGWKVEVGKDPTTGLNGFKIDDISGFGEASQPGSFKIEFTVCHDGTSCADSQNCWDAKIAHKAGLCITTETIPMCISHDNPTGDDICLAKAAEGGGHAAWINDYSNGSDAKFQFDENGGAVKQFPDGTGHISGTIYLPDSPEDKWEIDVWLTARKSWEEWSATGGSYKGDKDIVGDLYKTWSYYLLDVNKENRLIGKGKNDGEILLLSHYPAGYEYAAQLGNAANDKNSNYGLSIWWTFERNGKTVER